MVKISKVTILPPSKKWLESCFLIKCVIKSPPNQCITEINGLLLTDDEKIISRLEETPTFLSTNEEVIGSLTASDNARYRDLINSKNEHTIEVHFMAPLSQYTIDHIEKLREKKIKRNVELKLRFSVKYLESNVCTSHLVALRHPLSQLKSAFEEIKEEHSLKNPKLIVYDYNTDFDTEITNMWILSANSEAKFLTIKKSESEFSHTIPYDDWIYDFLPKFKAYSIVTIEIPTAEIAGSAYENLTKAVEELKHAEKFLREGNYDSVIRSLRNIISNRLTVVKTDGERKERVINEELKKMMIANIPKESEKEYKVVFNGIQEILRKLLQDHLSKFIHLDSERLIRMPLKADAEYLFLTTTSIIRYISTISSKEL